jgi:hypothetical protein
MMIDPKVLFEKQAKCNEVTSIQIRKLVVTDDMQLEILDFWSSQEVEGIR